MSEPLVIDNDTQQPVADGPDWDAIERIYRQNTLSNRELGAAYGISETAIRKRAKKHEWTRDMSQRVREMSEEMVRQHELQQAISGSGGEQPRTVQEAQDMSVLVGATALATIKLEQRSRLSRYRGIEAQLLAELEQAMGSKEAVKQAAEVLANASEAPPEKLLEAVERVASLPGRVAVFKKLAEVQAIIVQLERVTWGMDQEPPPPPPQTSIGGLLQDMQLRALPVVKEVPRDE